MISPLIELALILFISFDQLLAKAGLKLCSLPSVKS